MLVVKGRDTELGLNVILNYWVREYLEQHLKSLNLD